MTNIIPYFAAFITLLFIVSFYFGTENVKHIK